MTFRQATLSDLTTIVDLAAQFYHYFGYKFEYNHHQTITRQFLENPHFGSIWMMESEGTTVGYLALTYGFTFEFGGKDAFVDELFVAEAYRNRGFSKKALTEIQSKMSELGLCALHLQVEHYNQNAKRLYEAVGFKDMKRDTLSFSDLY